MRLSPQGSLLIPFLLMMCVFFVMPLCIGVIYSFLKAAPNGGVIWELSLDGYRRFFYSPGTDGTMEWNTGYLKIIRSSFGLATLTTLICVLVGFPIAWYMATRPPKQRDLWIILITIPFWTNLLIRTYAWILILRGDGLANSLLIKIGLLDTALPLLYNAFAVTLGLVYSFLPFMILPIYTSLERMDWRLVEAASDLYAGKWHTLRHVVLPLAMPGIMAGVVLVFIPAIGSFLAADLLGGGKHMMLGNLIEIQFGHLRNWPFGAAISVIMIVAVMIGLIVIARRGRGLRDVI